MKAKGTFAVKKWDEKTYKDIPPEMKMTKASVEYAFNGEIEGIASVEYLMFYSHDDPKDQHNSTATYLGLLRFEGTVLGKSGSFVMNDYGAFKGGVATSSFRIEEGSGTGSLKGIKGTASGRADRTGSHFELEYELP